MDQGKLHLMEAHYTESINDMTEDFIKASNASNWWNKILPVKTISKILRQSFITSISKAEYLHKNFERIVPSYRSLTKKYRELTSVIEEDSILEMEREQEKLCSKANLHETYTKVEDTYITGNQSKQRMLQSDADVNINTGEYQKSDDYLQNVYKADTELITYDYPERVTLDFSEFASKNSVTNNSEETVETKKESQDTKEHSTETLNTPIIKTYKGDAPDYYVAEQQLKEVVDAYGIQYAESHKSPQVEKVQELQLSTTTKEVIDQSDYQQNILGYVTKGKVLWAGAVYLLSVLGELLIFTNILGYVFNFAPPKSWISGSSALLISFIIGFGLYGLILHFIKNNNHLAVKLFNSSRLMAIAIGLSLIYTTCMGLLFNNQQQVEEIQGQMMQQYLIDPSELDEDMSEAERNRILEEKGTKIGNLQTQITHKRGGIMGLLTAITIALSSGIFMLLSGIMFSVLLLFASAHKMRQKKVKLEEEIANTEAEFYSSIHAINELHNHSTRIYRHIGAREFIRQLIAGGSPKEVIYSPNTYKASLNGQSHHVSNPTIINH